MNPAALTDALKELLEYLKKKSVSNLVCITQKQLAVHFKCTTQAISAKLMRLQVAGFIKREPGRRGMIKLVTKRKRRIQMHSTR